MLLRRWAIRLDLQAALGLVGEHPAADRIGRVIGELDQASTYRRDAIFDHARASAVADPDGSYVQPDDVKGCPGDLRPGVCSRPGVALCHCGGGCRAE